MSSMKGGFMTKKTPWETYLMGKAELIFLGSSYMLFRLIPFANGAPWFDPSQGNNREKIQQLMGQFDKVVKWKLDYFSYPEHVAYLKVTKAF